MSGDGNTEPEVTLAEAYSVASPDDNRDLYRRWADTYDRDFAAQHNYDYHNSVSQAFLDAGGSTDLVLDVGCGTGLVGQALRSRGVKEVHGLDISPEMLSKAADKMTDQGEPVYTSLREADLTARVDIADNTYPGLITAGTFTHGHLGPASLDEVVRLCAPGALLAVGVNADLFENEGGFGQWLADAEAEGRISAAHTVTVPVYGGGSTGIASEHQVGSKNAFGKVMVFQKN
ncbi:MAG: class I SAM-dependent methyltransferase [Acidimicrobiales bacterium]|nr:class I SAM-dependent methyltransferase [Acidimicrobiales bacterium]